MFKFELGEPVMIDVSGERGIVIGRAEYEASVPQYLILLKAADGQAKTAWWEANFLSSGVLS
jgi:hypothetical protein